MPPSIATPLHTVTRWSRITADLCLVLAVVFLMASLYQWLSISPGALRAKLDVPSIHWDSPRRMISIGLLMAPVAVVSLGLIRLRASFQCFAAGDLFTPKAVGGLRDFAAAGAASVGVSALVWPVIAALLTFDQPGGVQLAVNVGTGSLTILLISGVTWIFAHVLRLGAVLAEENAAFV